MSEPNNQVNQTPRLGQDGRPLFAHDAGASGRHRRQRPATDDLHRLYRQVPRRRGRKLPGVQRDKAALRGYRGVEIGIPLGDKLSPEGKALQQDWIDWLDNQPGTWRWFCTFTFNRDVSAAQAERRFKQWLARLLQSLKGQSNKHARMTYLLAIEYTTHKRVHMHAVIKSQCGILSRANRTRWAGKWDSIGPECGIAQVGKARAEACSYVVKYITKDGRITIGGPFTAWQLPESRMGNLPASSDIQDGMTVNPLGGTQRPAGESKSSYQTATPSEPDGSPG